MNSNENVWKVFYGCELRLRSSGMHQPVRTGCEVNTCKTDVWPSYEN